MSEVLTQIELDQAEAMLDDRPELHVVVMGEAEGKQTVQEAYWPRDRITNFMAKHGAYLSGPRARSANHGLFLRLENGASAFIETQHS